MDFHAHVTLKQPVAIPQGWKETSIVLDKDNRVQHDLMLTRHFRFNAEELQVPIKERVIVSIMDEILKLNLKDNVDRIKIEQDSLFFLPVNEVNYAEIHMLCKEGVVADLPGWVRSTNPRRQDGDTKFYFYNRRIYEGTSMYKIIEEVMDEVDTVPWVELAIEQAIFDTNRSRDSWWA